MGADNGIRHLAVVGKVGHPYPTQQADAIRLKARSVDDTGKFQHFLFEAYSAEQPCLLALGSMILKVFAEVSLVAGFSDGIPYLGKFYCFQLVKFGYEFVVAFF